MKNIINSVKYLGVLLSLVSIYALPVVSSAQYYYPLQVSCRPNTYSAVLNTQVGWSAVGTGGNGVYTYSWSGTDGLSGNANSVLQTYSTEGTKTASITVTSNGQTVTANCGSIYIYANQNYNNYGTLNGSCSANISNPRVGDTINWSAYAAGGNGIYTYSWNDSDGYSAVGQYLSRFYTTIGLKNMTLTISSNGQSIVRNCSVYVNANTVNPVYNPPYQNPTYPVQNQVLGTVALTPMVESVYLSDVPYTGFEESFKAFLFALSLVLWSGIMAYKFTKDNLEHSS